ncbi:MAG: sulfite exporter TauE/SafE family protein [Desulfurivibrionaceae bacterium]|jgi:hypothetical protein
MKKLLIILMFALVPLSLLAQSALAAGDGPSKDMLKGIITQVNAAERTIVFQKDDTKELLTLTLGEKMQPEDMKMNQKVLINLDKHAAGDKVMKDISIMFIDMSASKLIALLVIGAVGGLLSGFIGSGGAFVMTPAMMSLGVPGAVAVASNMCHKFPKAMVGAYKRWKYGQADIKLGLVMASTAVIGVQIGIKIQKYILNQFGGAGSNLYISAVFMVVLVFVGGYVFYDAWKLAKGGGKETVSKLAIAMQKIQLAPMIHFKTANVTISAWITIPVGLLTGMLAATIAVGGFVGVPGMIYVIGASAVVASATELIIAFVMGAWGSVQWGLSGLIDIRLALLLLATSLIGVQLGALGTTYVKDYIIKVVMATTMLIVAISRGVKIPGYLIDLDLMSPIDPGTIALLEGISFWSLVLALGSAALIIIVAMVKGMTADRHSKRALAGVNNG